MTAEPIERSLPIGAFGFRKIDFPERMLDDVLQEGTAFGFSFHGLDISPYWRPSTARDSKHTFTIISLPREMRCAQVHRVLNLACAGAEGLRLHHSRNPPARGREAD